MAVYTKDSRLSEPIFEDPSIVAVINRFGIFLGVGDCTISEICADAGIDTDFFLAVINTYLNPDYFPERIAERTHLSMVVNYLEKTDHYYERIQIPNIDRHFNLLMQRKADCGSESCGDNNLQLLNKFYLEVRSDFLSMIRDDIDYWFPYLKFCDNVSDDSFHKGYGIHDSRKIELPYDKSNIEDKIRDLISFFVIHLKGDYDRNLCVAVVSAISVLDKDIRQNNRIRDRILKPLCERSL